MTSITKFWYNFIKKLLAKTEICFREFHDKRLLKDYNILLVIEKLKVIIIKTVSFSKTSALIHYILPFPKLHYQVH